jgi:DNA-binding protein YbaB
MSEIAQQLLARIETIDKAAADNRMRSESYQRMADELQNAEGRATSPDGIVTVVAGPGGSVTSITFTEQIRAVSPEALSASVMQAMAQARASAAQQQAEVVRRGLGDTELLDRVLDSDARLFGDTRPSAPASSPAPVAAAAGRRRASHEESYEDSGVLSEESF